MNKNNFIQFLKNETVLIIATLGAVITSFWVSPSLKNINFHVLEILFNLMIVVEIYKKESILDWIAVNFLKKYTNQRIISALLILLVFLFGMFLTNDVALITFVPLTLIIGKKANFDVHILIILETFAANLGGALTPMGSPQNLYIFTKYNLIPFDFFRVTGSLSLLGLFFILVYNLKTPNNPLIFELSEPKIRKNYNGLVATIIFISLIICILFKLNTLPITILTLCFLIFNKKNHHFAKIDWFLLLTFVGFFIFIGNLSQLPIINNIMRDALSSTKKVYLNSIIFSQVISNVPSALLLSQFTHEWKPLLVGVNIGNFGTMVASLANLISYKLYLNEFPKEKNSYLKDFALLNLIFLVALTTIFYKGF